MCLLDRVAERAGFDLLSDMRFAGPEGRARIAAALREVPAEAAALAEWNDALEYLVGGRPRRAAEDARAALLRSLEEEGRR